MQDNRFISASVHGQVVCRPVIVSLTLHSVSNVDGHQWLFVIIDIISSHQMSVWKP